MIFNSFLVKGLDCGSVPEPENGKVTYVNGTSLYDDSIQFACNPGYDLNGTETADCLATRNWSHEVPKCQRKS